MGIILFCEAKQIYSILEDGRQRYFGCRQVDKKTYAMFVGMRYQQIAPPGPYIDREQAN